MSGSGGSSSARRLPASIAVLASVATLVAALLVAALFVFEFRVTLDSQRERIERALSDALGVPVLIAGPIALYTGPHAGLALEQLRAGSAESPGGWQLDAERLTGRVQTLALLRREIRIVDLGVDGAVVCIRIAQGPSPAGGPRRPASSWTLTDIGRVAARQVSVVTDPGCDPAQRRTELQTLELRAPQGAPVSLSARAVVAGVPAQIDAQGPPLAAFAGHLADQPFELSAGFADASARVAGRVDLARRAFDAQLAFDAPEFAALLRPLGVPFEDFGPLRARARVAADRAGLKVRFDELSLASLTASAEATLDWSADRPSLALSVRTGRLDVASLRDWLARSQAAGPSEPGALQRWAIAALRASDGRFAFEIEQLDAGALHLSALSWSGRWRQGELASDAQGRLGRSPVVAALNTDLRGDAPVVTAKASAQNVVLPAGPVAGVFASLSLDGEARGPARADDGWRSSASVAARSATLTLATGQGQPVALAIDRARVRWRQGESLVGDAAGSLFGAPASVELRGADIAALWQDRPWALDARGRVAALRLACPGSLALRGAGLEAELSCALHADRLGDLAPASLAGLPLDAQGALALQAGRWRIDLQRLRLGRTDASGWAAGSVPMDAPIQAEMQFATLDLAQLTAGPAAAATAGFVLPRRLVLPAADLKLGASRIVLPGAIAADARIDARLRDGRLDRSPFAFALEGAAVRGTLSADLRAESARIALDADAEGLDSARLGGPPQASGLGLRIDALNLAASATGNDAGELTAQARLDLTLRQAAVTMAARGSAPALSAEISAATLSAAPGQPTRLALDGDLMGLPAHLEASLPGLTALGGSADAGFQARGRLDRIDVQAEGAWPGPALPDRALRISVAAPTLAAFDRVLGQDLPDTAPFQLDAELGSAADGGPSASARLALGESRVDAQLQRERAGERPLWRLDLASPRLRLEDLGSAGWLAEPGRDAAPPARLLSPGAAGHAHAHLQQIREALRVALGRFDARARVAVDHITSGADDFGRLQAEASLDAGRLRIAPLTLAGPRGDLRLAAGIDLSGDRAAFDLDADLSRFEYGRLVQTIDPRRDGEGELSLRLQLKGHGSADDPLRSLDGRVGALILPTKAADVRLLERWGSGLLANVGAALDSTESHLNCAVATFGVTHGVAKSEALMLDTTRVRAAGELEVDLPSGQLKGTFASKSKRPELFSARLPVVVGGSLQKPTIAPATGSVVLTTARYVLFAYAYLFDTVGAAGYAPDGRPDCVATYGRLQQ